MLVVSCLWILFLLLLYPCFRGKATSAPEKDQSDVTSKKISEDEAADVDIVTSETCSDNSARESEVYAMHSDHFAHHHSPHETADSTKHADLTDHLGLHDQTFEENMKDGYANDEADTVTKKAIDKVSLTTVTPDLAVC